MSVYSVTEIIGTSSTSGKKLAAEAIKTAGQHLREIFVSPRSLSRTSIWTRAGQSPTAPSFSSRSSTQPSTEASLCRSNKSI